jgi:hypothetical protein
MKHGPDIAQIAALIGDPARANILTALMAGQALTATELANEAGITAQTASPIWPSWNKAGCCKPASKGGINTQAWPMKKWPRSWKA